MEEKIVKLGAGEVTIREPLAGVVNKAMIKAEQPDGSMKKTVLMVELLPHCIAKHPWGTKPIRQSLDHLRLSEYNKLVDVVAGMIARSGDVQKKSEQLSETPE